MESFMSHGFVISDIALCALVKAGTGKPVHRNRASHGIVYYPHGGCDFSFCGGKTFKLRKNSVIYLPQGSDYDVTASSSHDCYAINFRLESGLVCAPFAVTVRNTSLFEDAFASADRIYKSGKPGYIMKCQSILCEVISALQYEYSLGYISGKDQSLISAALDIIHETYTENTPGISELAQICGISPEYFRTLFRKACGKPPIKYINDLRLSRAKELLCSGMYSVSDVCFMSGFCDVSYFSREFKKNTGTSPSEYAGSK